MRNALRIFVFQCFTLIALCQTPDRHPWGEWQEFSSGGQPQIKCRGQCSDWGPRTGAGGFGGYSWDVECENVTNDTVWAFDVGIDGHDTSRQELEPEKSDIAGSVAGGRAVSCDRVPNITISNVESRAAQ